MQFSPVHDREDGEHNGADVVQTANILAIQGDVFYFIAEFIRTWEMLYTIVWQYIHRG